MGAAWPQLTENSSRNVPSIERLAAESLRSKATQTVSISPRQRTWLHREHRTRHVLLPDAPWKRPFCSRLSLLGGSKQSLSGSWTTKGLEET